MRRLIDRFRGDDGEDGATLVIIAMSLVALIGMVGLAIDAGAVFVERRELSRGADAAVLAVAEDCALGVVPCDQGTAEATAGTYADDNADDGAATIDELLLDLTEQTVYARTKTIDPADGTDQFKLFFMRVLGIDSVTVTAEATAAWGVAGGAYVLPIIISDCEYLKSVDGEGVSDPIVVYFHDGNTTEDCSAQAGMDADGDGILSGGFGWLLTEGDCTAEMSEDNPGYVDADPGASPSTGCGPDTLYDLIFNQTVLIPYFDDLVGVGAGGQYHVSGIGAFYVTGYNFGGQYKAPSASTAPCSGDERCIAGYFTRAVLYDGDIATGDFVDRGAYVVKLTG